MRSEVILSGVAMSHRSNRKMNLYTLSFSGDIEQAFLDDYYRKS